MQALFELGPLADKEHSRPRELSFVPQLPQWDPHSKKSSSTLEFIQSAGIELVRLVDHPQHELGLSGMDKPRRASSAFDLVHDRVPVPHRLHRYRTSWGALDQERGQGSGCMGDLPFPFHPALLVLRHRIDVSLMAVEGQILYRALLFPSGRVPCPRGARFHNINSWDTTYAMDLGRCVFNPLFRRFFVFGARFSSEALLNPIKHEGLATESSVGVAGLFVRAADLTCIYSRSI